MLVRRPLPWIWLLAAALHGVGIARTPLPAQDGLKYIRVAKGFASQPWLDVVRGSDQHPLYPMLIAGVHGLIGPFVGPGAAGWRLAAQLASLLATLGVLTALYHWTRDFESKRTAAWACLIWLALPIPARLGHDTLGDGIAWAAILASLAAGARWLDTGGRRAAVGFGLAAGVGYLARPEVAMVPIALLGAVGCRAIGRRKLGPSRRLGAGLALFLVIVGGYALAKGQISEKLSLRLAAGLGPSAGAGAVPRVAANPAGLEGAGWDFSPKEESGSEPGGYVSAGLRLVQASGEGLGWLGGALVGVGLVVGRRRGRSAGLLAAVFALGFAAVLVRHEASFGYLSERHVMPIVLLCLPRAAMGLRSSMVALGTWRGWSQRRRRMTRLVGVLVLVGVGLGIQVRPGHPSRWGHWAAGQWLRANAEAGAAVLDTRGWAAFVSDLRSYDYWHVRQALTDSRLSYVVVTRDELESTSARGASLRALLAAAGTHAASFPERAGRTDPSILVYRFRAPRSWEGVRP